MKLTLVRSYKLNITYPCYQETNPVLDRELKRNAEVLQFEECRLVHKRQRAIEETQFWEAQLEKNRELQAKFGEITDRNKARITFREYLQRRDN